MAAKKKTPAKKASGTTKTVQKKTSAGKKTSSPAPGGKKPLGQELKKVFLGIGILLAICLTVAMLADIFINSRVPVDPPRPPQTKVAKTQKPEPKAPPPAVAPRKPEPPETGQMAPMVAEMTDTKKKAEKLKEKEDFVYEVFDHVDHDRDKPGVTPGTVDETMPQIAIIIDDIGYDKKVAMGLFDISADITFSVLPFSPFGKTLAKRLGERGAELMLHLPMEPSQYPKVNPGPGALLSSMGPDALVDQLRKDIDAVPGVVGVNNHMGSYLTTRADQMNQIFIILKKRDLFFVDSRTAADSQGMASARLFQLRFSQRDIFLDNIQEVAYITGQFTRLVNIALKHGTAVGIGHPYPATLETLEREIPKLKDKVKVVRASRLVAIPG